MPAASETGSDVPPEFQSLGRLHHGIHLHQLVHCYTHTASCHALKTAGLQYRDVRDAMHSTKGTKYERGSVNATLWSLPPPPTSVLAVPCYG